MKIYIRDSCKPEPSPGRLVFCSAALRPSQDQMVTSCASQTSCSRRASRLSPTIKCLEQLTVTDERDFPERSLDKRKSFGHQDATRGSTQSRETRLVVHNKCAFVACLNPLDPSHLEVWRFFALIVVSDLIPNRSMEHLGGRRGSAKGRRRDLTRGCLGSSVFRCVCIVLFGTWVWN